MQTPPSPQFPAAPPAPTAPRQSQSVVPPLPAVRPSRNTHHATGSSPLVPRAFPLPILSLLFALCFLLPAHAQTNTPPPANRYLLVVETSRSMQRRAPGILNTLGELVTSGFHGQIHPDDTLGLWTFNEDLYTGRFPLQHWTPRDRTDIADRVLAFLNEQKYEKQTSFDKLLPALSRLVKDSPYLTIVLVTDGEDKLRGTPFDDRINDTFHAWRERQQLAQMPFVTVLRARQGVLTDANVSAAPWPVEMPPLPPELRLPEVAVQPAATPKPPAPTVPPLIIHGKKPEPAPAGAPESTKSTTASLEQTNTAVAQLSPPSPAASNLIAAATASTPAPIPATKTDPSSPAAQPPASAKPAPAPALTASATPPPASALVPHPATTPSSGRKGFWLVVALACVALLGLAAFLFTRARPSRGPSLITQSLERQAK